jgi:hypothetical protein
MVKKVVVVVNVKETSKSFYNVFNLYNLFNNHNPYNFAPTNCNKTVHPPYGYVTGCQIIIPIK